MEVTVKDGKFHYVRVSNMIVWAEGTELSSDLNIPALIALI